MNYIDQVNWVVEQFAAMGATEEDLKSEYYKMMCDPDYLYSRLDLLDYKQVS